LLLWVEPVNWNTLASYPAGTWIGLGILGFFSWGLSMVLFFRVLSRLEVTQVSLSIYLLPFFGILLSALFLNEKISGAIIGGGLLVLTGTSLVLFADNGIMKSDQARQLGASEALRHGGRVQKSNREDTRDAKKSTKTQ